MKIQKHERTNKTRYYCRYSPKNSNEGKDEFLDNDNPFLKSFGPELKLSQHENNPGKLFWYHSFFVCHWGTNNSRCWNIDYIISKCSFEDTIDNGTNFKPRKAVFAPGSFFYPTLIFGDEIESITDGRSGDVSFKFHDQPIVDMGGMDYAPTDFIWVCTSKKSINCR